MAKKIMNTLPDEKKEFYQFINRFTSACKNNGVTVNDNAALIMLEKPYQKYGPEQMRMCLNEVIDRAIKKRQNGERIRCIVRYALQLLQSDFKPLEVV
jgi:hypothetical protein